MNSKVQSTDNYLPIRELSARTQVNTVTLRAWERRYGLLTPQRSPKGHRLYSEQDVKTIEKVLALVERGVPIGKVKPLLQSDILQIQNLNDSNSWQTSVSTMLEAVELFSATKIESLIKQSLANYPIDVCRVRLLEPVFSALAKRDDKGAAFGFMENELIQYGLMRLGAKVKKKAHTHAVTLLAGNNAPMWRLVVMALELTDLDFSVYLFSRALSVETGMELTEHFNGSHVVFYQDGVLKEGEKALLAQALLDNENLFLCGTAPVLTRFDHNTRVFGDARSCIDSLQK